MNFLLVKVMTEKLISGEKDFSCGEDEAIAGIIDGDYK